MKVRAELRSRVEQAGADASPRVVAESPADSDKQAPTGAAAERSPHSENNRQSAAVGSPERDLWLNLGLSILMLIIMAYAAFSAQGFNPVVRWFPLFVSVAGGLVAAIAVIAIVRSLVVMRSSVRRGVVAGQIGSQTQSDQSDTKPLRGFLLYIVWFIALGVAIQYLGMPLGIALWLLLFLYAVGRERILRALTGALIGASIVTVIMGVLNVMAANGSLVDSGSLIPRGLATMIGL